MDVTLKRKMDTGRRARSKPDKSLLPNQQFMRLPSRYTPITARQLCDLLPDEFIRKFHVMSHRVPHHLVRRNYDAAIAHAVSRDGRGQSRSSDCMVILSGGEF